LVSMRINHVLHVLSSIQTQSYLLSLKALPSSTQQRGEFVQLLQAIPQVETDLAQVHDLLGSAGWILGVDQPRTFLVQTMDRAELRRTGGCAGRYGELLVNG